MLREGDNMMGIKRSNRGAVLRILHEQGEMSRKRLAECIKLTPAAITKIVGELIEDGLVFDGTVIPGSGVGRREVMVGLDYRSRCSLGILINLRQAIVSALWLDGEVIFSEEIALEPHAPVEQTVVMLCGRLMELAEEYKLPKSKILGVGIAIRGITSPDGRIMHNSFRALDCRDYPLAELVEKLTGHKVVIANNVRALLAAQMFLSKDHELRSQFFMRCEYGIGAALSINDEIWLGGTGQCSEIGHIPIIPQGGKLCSCGKTGCLETIASPTAIREDALAILSPEKTPILWKIASKKGAESITLKDVLDSAKSGDAGTAGIVNRAVSALAFALKSVIYTIDPEKIVLYGQMFENNYYLTRLMAEMGAGVDDSHSTAIEKSAYNQILDNKAAALIMVAEFFKNGGME